MRVENWDDEISLAAENWGMPQTENNVVIPQSDLA
jgi:hypothetical protein